MTAAVQTELQLLALELIRTQLELVNGDDLALVRRKKLPVEDIRKMTVTAQVDSGAMMLAINESICQQLGLLKVDARLAELADGSVKTYDVVGPVEVRIPHRRCSSMTRSMSSIGMAPSKTSESPGRTIASTLHRLCGMRTSTGPTTS